MRGRVDSKGVFATVLCRLRGAFTTWASLRYWVEAALLLAGFAALALPLGVSTGLLEFEPPAESITSFLMFAAVALVVPSMFEETIFRALLLPHTSETRSLRFRALSMAIAVPLFVLGHPLIGILVPSCRELFFDLRFLVLCVGFGAASSLVYLRSGSIWPSVTMHWTVVVAWKLWFGGWIFMFGPNA